MAFSLALIIILGLCADFLFRKIKLPGLVGMIIIGIIVGPYLFNLISGEMMKVSGDFRKIALIVILLRAGFELHKETLNRVGRAALIMSIVPAIFEIFGVLLLAPFLLGMSYLEALILGSILAAVSPAVVVPLMIDFMDRGRGNKKGIPTLILGASSLDDVFVIVLFTVFLGLHSGDHSNLFFQISTIPISIILGIIIGIIPGYILFKLFNKYDWRPPKRTLIVLGVSILLTWFEEICSEIIPVASLLGVMAIGFIILEKSEAIAHIISQKLKKLWVFAELLLFILVGAQVNIHVAWKAGLAGAIIILVGLVFRSIGTYISLYGTPFNWKEKIFCIISYLPKATVQAAIGAVPLSIGVVSGEVILAIAVLSIIITAPLGAIAIKYMGERILDHSDKSVYRFKDLRKKFELPHVGQRVRSKKYGTTWKVIEEKEVWVNNNILIPAISFRFWEENPNTKPGTGKTITYQYKSSDKTFHKHWEILYDW